MSATGLAQEFLSFVNASPSPFHAVQAAKERLLQAGFKELKEKLPWTTNDIQPLGKYFFTRNQSSVVAFAVGAGPVQYNIGGHGFSILAAHTDSPCLKVKPVSRKESNGYLQVGVQTYGGGLWHTWFDRDLSIAGRVVVQSPSGQLESKLVRIDRPLLRVPTLAIHLDRTVNDSFKFNNETHLTPILASSIKNQLKYPKDKTLDEKSVKPSHHDGLVSLLAEKLNINADSILDFELCLYDTMPAALGGLYNEFIFSPRLDNLMMSFCSLEALLASLKDESLAEDPNIRLIALFDNEEVGSETAHGAGSNLLESTMRRITHVLDETSLEEAAHKSFLISADMAHAVHPNYSEKHESNHQPAMHKGIVIKNNANQRYATTAVTSSILKTLATRDAKSGQLRSNPIPLQEFVVRNDSPCGSTIGPILSAKLGMRTVDVGAPQLSMHSIREMCATEDVKNSVELFTAFLRDFAAVDAKLRVD